MGLEKETGEMLASRHLSLALAESCTGGLLASRVTDIPGSSDYFLGGVVAYANRVKEQVLDVPGDLIDNCGAVSREVALSMARGARRLLGSDIAIAITGVAGPNGGTPLKPVGLVYIALSAEGYEECREFHWQGTRRQNKKQSTEAAFHLLQAYLTGSHEGP